MNLVMHIPYRTDEDSTRALSLAQRSPSFTIEWTDGIRVAIAIFSSLPEGIETAVTLIGESIHLSGAWASVDRKPISSLVKLWHRLTCYQESLAAADPLQHCTARSAGFQDLVGCEAHRCPVPCQFICTPCLRMAQEGGEVSAADRFRVAAELAEVNWCPRLQFPSHETPSLFQPQLTRPPNS